MKIELNTLLWVVQIIADFIFFFFLILQIRNNARIARAQESFMKMSKELVTLLETFEKRDAELTKFKQITEGKS